MNTLSDKMQHAANPSQVEGLSRFFKTGPGQYGEGDVFLGIKVPVTRNIVKELWKETSFEDLEECMTSKYHEMRLAALLTLVQIFKHARKDVALQQRCVDFYLSHKKFVNNWDLVDLSCYEILGPWLMDKDRTGQKPFIFQIINFFGLNMMPTIVVFAVMLPGLEMMCGPYMTTGNSVEKVPYACNWLTWIGFAVCIAAATIQLIADTQRHRFAQGHKGEVCKVGLWKHGRHPNYFGEISMWWGVWIMFVSVNGLSNHLWYLAGPVAMTCLFLVISIPLMEKRQLQNKPGYAQYKKETRILI